MAWKNLEGKAVVYNLTGTVIGLKYYDDFFSVGEFEVWDYLKGYQKTVTVDNFKKDYNTGCCSFIKLNDYLKHGILVGDYDYIIEETINPLTTQQLDSLSLKLPSGFSVNWGELKPTNTYKTSVCECGGKIVGLKDYQVGHSHWCPVYHKKKKTK